jgi:hypothetical protein
MTVQEFVNIDKDLQTVQDISDVHVQCSLVKPPPSVQSVVWRYNEFGDKLRGIENRKLCDHMKR